MACIMKAQSNKPAAYAIGLRVQHCVDQRFGFVCGRPERWGTRHTLVPVIVEGSTRQELWPDSQLQLLPKAQQHPAHGGRFQAPAGYPLVAA